MESLVVLSDVHLGSDLGVPGAVAPARSVQIDDDLCRLIDHYRSTEPNGERWRLVVAGDFIDFVGMTLPTDAPGTETAPNEEELLHGLGNAEDHAVAKMHAVAVRHREIFAALGRFVAEGHAITFIRGNHDVELHWALVRAELTRTIVEHARAWSEDPAAHGGRALPFDAAAIAARIEGELARLERSVMARRRAQTLLPVLRPAVPRPARARHVLLFRRLRRGLRSDRWSEKRTGR